MFYEVFWCLILYKSKTLGIVLSVFIITCMLEFVQLLNNELPEIVRSNFIGKTITGNSFTWNDFPYYMTGSALGYFILRVIEKYKLQPVDE